MFENIENNLKISKNKRIFLIFKSIFSSMEGKDRKKDLTQMKINLTMELDIDQSFTNKDNFCSTDTMGRALMKKFPEYFVTKNIMRESEVIFNVKPSFYEIPASYNRYEKVCVNDHSQFFTCSAFFQPQINKWPKILKIIDSNNKSQNYQLIFLISTSKISYFFLQKSLIVINRKRSFSW